MINNANLIWLKEKDINHYMDAQQTFTASKSEKVSVSIFSDTEYVICINGKYVGSGQFKSYENSMVYDEYDVTDLLNEGENTLDVIANHQGTSSFTYIKREAALAFAVYSDEKILAVSGKDTKVRQNANYQSGKMEITSPQTGYVYYYDANNKPGDWEEPVIKEKTGKFEKRPVDKLLHLPLKQGKLLTQGTFKRKTTEGTVAQMMLSDYLSFEDKATLIDGDKVKANGDGRYLVYDFGEETAGLFSMSITAKEGTVIEIAYGEHVDATLRVRASMADFRNFACKYVCREGKQDFTGYFRRFAGRYLQIQISGTDSDVEIHNIGFIPTVYPLKRKSAFKCEDYLFDKIYEAGVHTLELCMHEHYEDCPWREQSLYAFDSYIQMLCGYYTFGEYEFARASLKLLADSQLDCGLLEICAPAEASITIPSFSLNWIMSLEKYVLYSGDVDFAREMLGTAKKILDSFKLVDGLVELQSGKRFWHFYEWSKNLNGVNKDGCGFAALPEGQTDSVANMYYILACEAYDNLSKWCGTEGYGVDTDIVRNAVRKRYTDEATGLIKTHDTTEDGLDELTQSLALFCGITDDKRVLDSLANYDNDIVKCTLSASLFKYEIMFAKGGEYRDRAIDEIAKIWGGMLFIGSDTFWEVAPGNYKSFGIAGSKCHGWSSLPIYIMYKYLAGFEPLAPGFEKYKLEPVKVKNIGTIKADLFTPDGKIQ